MEKDILQRIKQVIDDKQVSITKISKAINIPQATLHKQITGESAMTLKTLNALLNYFNDVSTEWIFRNKGEMILEPLKLSFEDYLLFNPFEKQPWKKSTNQEKNLQESNSEIEEENQYIKHYSSDVITHRIIQDYQKMNESLIELNKKQQKQMDEFINIISHITIEIPKEEK